jgi:hypothetical protein
MQEIHKNFDEETFINLLLGKLRRKCGDNVKIE